MINFPVDEFIRDRAEEMESYINKAYKCTNLKELEDATDDHIRADRDLVYIAIATLDGVMLDCEYPSRHQTHVRKSTHHTRGGKAVTGTKNESLSIACIRKRRIQCVSTDLDLFETAIESLRYDVNMYTRNLRLAMVATSDVTLTTTRDWVCCPSPVDQQCCRHPHAHHRESSLQGVIDSEERSRTDIIGIYQFIRDGVTKEWYNTIQNFTTKNMYFTTLYSVCARDDACCNTERFMVTSYTWHTYRAQILFALGFFLETVAAAIFEHLHQFTYQKRALLRGMADVLVLH